MSLQQTVPQNDQEDESPTALVPNPLVVTEMYRVSAPWISEYPPGLHESRPCATLHGHRKLIIYAFVSDLLLYNRVIAGADQHVPLADVTRHPDKTAWRLVSHRQRTRADTGGEPTGPVVDVLLIISPWGRHSATSWPRAALMIKTRLDAFLDDQYPIRVEMLAPELYFDHVVLRTVDDVVGSLALVSDWVLTMHGAVVRILERRESTKRARAAVSLFLIAPDGRDRAACRPTVRVGLHGSRPSIDDWTLAREELRAYLATTTHALELLVEWCRDCCRRLV